MESTLSAAILRLLPTPDGGTVSQMKSSSNITLSPDLTATNSHQVCSPSCDILTGCSDILEMGISSSFEFMQSEQILPVESPLSVEELCGFSLEGLTQEAAAKPINGGHRTISLSGNAQEFHQEVSTSHAQESIVCSESTKNSLTIVVASEVVCTNQYEALGKASDCNINEEANVIYWHQGEGTYIHPASGMSYCPESDMYYNFVSPNLDGPRELYYTPVNKTLMLTREGQLGKANEEILKDKDWDRSFLYSENSVGYISNLAELFRAKIAEGPP